LSLTLVFFVQGLFLSIKSKLGLWEVRITPTLRGFVTLVLAVGHGSAWNGGSEHVHIFLDA